MEVSWPISSIVTIKLVSMITPLEISKKDGQISNLRSNTYHMVKFGENRSGVSLYNFSKKFNLKEVTTGCIRLSHS